MVECSALHNATVFESNNLVGESHHVSEGVHDKHDGNGELCQVRDKVGAQGRVPIDVESRKGFVEQKKIRSHGESARQGNPLRFSARQFGGATVGEHPDLQAVEPVTRDAASETTECSVLPRPEGDVLEHGQMGKEQGVLKDHADASALRRQLVDPSAVELDTCILELKKAGEREKQA